MVWDLILLSDPEGPTLISCAARLLLVSHHDFLSAPSWRTVIGKTDDDYPAGRMLLTPRVDPQVEYVVQVDIGQKRRNHSPDTIENFPYWLNLSPRRRRLQEARAHQGAAP